MDANGGTIHRLIGYFRDCLLEDGGERQIVDVFGRDERQQYLFPCPPEQWQAPPPVELPRTYAQQLTALLDLQRQERELLFGTCLVTGPGGEIGGRLRSLRAPLFQFNAELQEQFYQYRVIADPDSLRCNPLALDALGLPADLIAAAGELALDNLLDQLADLREIGHSEKPRSWRRGSPVGWAASGVVWATARSQLARSVAYELDELGAGRTVLSGPLRQILGEPQQRPVKVAAARPETLPARLTAAQERTLHNAAAEIVSVINGPPGTGKTHTIACQTLDRVLRDERVLIVCSNEHAADVVRGKLADLFGEAQELIVRAGRSNYRQLLLAQLDRLLNGEIDLARHPQPERLEGELAAMTRARLQDEQQFRKALAQAVAEGESSRNRASAGPWQRLRLWWLRRQLARRPLLSQRWAGLEATVAEHQELARGYLLALAQANLHDLLQTRRRQLTGLRTALRSRDSGRREQRFGALDWRVLTRAFPVWVVSAQALHRVLPLESELFDLVILDEATQCNLPLALPALQRARRAVIVGDPKQLRHFSFLARARQTRLAERHGVTEAMLDLDYRERSLLDYALAAVADNAAIVLLDEHFRSHPLLIGFSNQRFYGGRLRILTRFRGDPDAVPLELIDCPVNIAGEINQSEVDALLERLQALIGESRDLADHECPRIGVLAFFRATALALERELLERFDLRTVSRHELRVGTPYAFQGEERDTMLIATGVYPDRSPAAWAYINRPEVFNVAVTRARHRQLLFMPAGSLDEQGSSLLAEYLAYVRRGRSIVPVRAASREEDALRGELIEVLEQLGAHCRVDYPFAGGTLDLLALREDQALAIDIVGCETPGAGAWDWERYRQLERAGLTLFPVSGFAWRERRAEVLEQLQRCLGAQFTALATANDRQLRSLRWRLRELRDPELLVLLDELERAHGQATHWLDARFTPEELTYGRYRQGMERLQQAAITELEGACVLLEGLRELAPEMVDKRFKADLSGRVEGCRQAVEQLDGLAGQLAVLRTERSDLEDALEDLARLTERVPLYGAAQASPSRRTMDIETALRLARNP